MLVNTYPFAKINYELPPEELVVNLINADNGTDFCKDRLLFGLPVVVRNAKHNTKITVNPSTKNHLSGSTTVRYNRIDISTVAIGKSTLFQIDAETKLSDLIPAINLRYKLKLTTADYLDITLPVVLNVPNDTATVDLVVPNTSLVFVNKLTLTIERAMDVALGSVITSPLLHGLTYTKPLLNHLIDY